MTPLAVRPIERCRVSSNAVLESSASATVCHKQQGDMLTSQTTTVLGAHLTRTWKSWPSAIWSYRNFNKKSLSSCLYPMMWRVTVALCQSISNKRKEVSLTLRVHINCFLASSLPTESVCTRGYPNLKDLQDVFESGDVSKSLAPYAQYYLGFCCFELVQVLRLTRQPFT